MFDSHCHLHDATMRGSWRQALDRARAAGVRGFMLAGVDPSDWQAAGRIATEHADVHLSYGIHPQVVAQLGQSSAGLATLETYVESLSSALQNPEGPRPQAIGEIGLDVHTEFGRETLTLQEQLFKRQLAIARAFDLPVILHILHAHGRALEVLEEDGLPRAGGVLHSYSGSSELVSRYLQLGLYFSFSGIITHSKVRRAREALVKVPTERLLVETDAPFQAPYLNGTTVQRSEPAQLPVVIRAMAALRNEEEAQVATYTDANARRLFNVL